MASIKNFQHKRVFTLILILSVGIVLGSVIRIQYRTINIFLGGDEYYQFARANSYLSHNVEFYQNFGFPNHFEPYPPGEPLLIVLLNNLGFGFFQIEWILIIFAIIVLVIMTFLLGRSYNYTVGMLAALLAILSIDIKTFFGSQQTTYIAGIWTINPPVFSFIFSVTTIYAIVNILLATQNSVRKRFCFILGAALTLQGLTHFDSFVWLMIVIMVLSIVMALRAVSAQQLSILSQARMLNTTLLLSIIAQVALYWNRLIIYIWQIRTSVDVAPQFVKYLPWLPLGCLLSLTSLGFVFMPFSILSKLRSIRVAERLRRLGSTESLRHKALIFFLVTTGLYLLISTLNLKSLNYETFRIIGPFTSYWGKPFSFENIVIRSLGAIQLILVTLGLLWLSRKKTRSCDLLLMIFYPTYFLSLSGATPISIRPFDFAINMKSIIPLMIALGIFFLYEYILVTSNKKFQIAMFVLACGALIMFFMLTFVSIYYKEPAVYNQDVGKAKWFAGNTVDPIGRVSSYTLEFVNNNVQENKKILTSAETADNILAFTHNTVVLSNRAAMGAGTTIQDRYPAASRIRDLLNPTHMSCSYKNGFILTFSSSYNVSYILLGAAEVGPQYETQPYTKDQQFDKIYENSKDRIYQIISNDISGCQKTSVTKKESTETKMLDKDLQIPQITYHVIDNITGLYHISPLEFQKQISILNSSGYQTITFSDYYLWRRKSNFSIVDKPIFITFDDGSSTVINNAKPIMDKYHYKGIAAVVTGWIDKPGYMSWSDLMELQHSNWEIASHSVGHKNMTGSDVEVRIEEFNISQTEIREHLNMTPVTFVFPFNKQDIAVRSECLNYYEGCTGKSRNFQPGNIQYVHKNDNLTQVGLTRNEILSTTSLTDFNQTFTGEK